MAPRTTKSRPSSSSKKTAAGASSPTKVRFAFPGVDTPGTRDVIGDCARSGSYFSLTMEITLPSLVDRVSVHPPNPTA